MGNATGGSVPTDNPQNIGSQNTDTSQNGLQSQGTNLFAGSTLRLTDQNGQPLNLTSTTTTPIQANPKTNNHHTMAIVGISGLLIVVVFVVTWLMTKKSGLIDH